MQGLQVARRRKPLWLCRHRRGCMRMRISSEERTRDSARCGQVAGRRGPVSTSNRLAANTASISLSIPTPVSTSSRLSSPLFAHSSAPTADASPPNAKRPVTSRTTSVAVVSLRGAGQATPATSAATTTTSNGLLSSSSCANSPCPLSRSDSREAPKTIRASEEAKSRPVPGSSGRR